MKRGTERLFSPNSLIWRLTRENVLLAGGSAAAILQIAHPQVGWGVANHSNFRAETLGRLSRTLDAVYTVTFGSLEEIEAMAERVRRVHARVKGETPRAYSAFDLDAQLWVLATLIALSVEIYERWVAALTLEEKQQFLDEMRIFGEWFGLPRAHGPESWTEFRSYYDGVLNSEDLGSEAVSKELARHIAYPERPLVLRMLWPVSGHFTREFLPSPLRERLGFRAPSPGVSRWVDATMRRVLPWLPGRLRYTPKYGQAILRDRRRPGG